MASKNLGRVKGLSAYEVALSNGYVGTEEEWLASLKGPKGDPGSGGGSADIPKSNNNIKGIYHVQETDSISTLTSANTNYVFSYKHNLSNATWNIPAGCILTFQGGAILNGTLKGNNTQIEDKIDFRFGNITFAGTWNIKDIYPEWFKNPDSTENLDVYWNNSLQKAINLSGYTKAPVKLTANEYMLYNWLRDTTTGVETDRYDSLLTIASYMTIYSDNKSRIKVLPLTQSNSQFYCAVLGHRYEGTSAYNKSTRWTDITLRNIIIDNYDDNLATSYTATQIINKYCFYAYNISNLIIEDCEMYCSGSNCVYIDISYKTQAQNISDVRDVANNAVLRHNYFRIKEKQKAYDLSGLFIAMNNVEFHDNVVEHHYLNDLDKDNDHWGCGGLEIHGPGFNVHDNKFIGFYNGINDCNYTGEPDYHIIENNVFDGCDLPIALWSIVPNAQYTWTNYRPLQMVRFVGNTCLNCRGAFRQSTLAQQMKDIEIRDNIFEFSVVKSGGVINFARMQQGAEILVEDNIFKNCCSAPFLEATVADGVEVVNPSKFVFKRNQFLNCFKYAATQKLNFFYFVPGSTESELIVEDNIFDIPTSGLAQRPMLFMQTPTVEAKRYKASYVNNVFPNGKMLAYNNTVYYNGLGVDITKDFPNSHYYQSTWADETGVKYAAAPMTLDSANTESRECTFEQDHAGWTIKTDYADEFRVGDYIRVSDATGKYIATRLIYAKNGDVLYASQSQGNTIEAATGYVIVQTGTPKQVRTYQGGLEADKPTNPMAGCNWFCTDSKKELIYDGTSWVAAGSESVQSLGRIADLNVDTDTINTRFATFFTGDNPANKPDDWSAVTVGTYATGFIYRPSTEWIQVVWRTTVDGSGTYTRFKNASGNWTAWKSVDSNLFLKKSVADETYAAIGNSSSDLGRITDTNVDVTGLTSVYYTFNTGETCSNIPWTTYKGGLYATGYIMKKGTQWQMTIYRATASGDGIYTKYCSGTGVWSAWSRVDNGCTNLGTLSTFDVTLADLKTDVATYVATGVSDGSGPADWADQEGDATGMVYKVSGYVYQTAFRMNPVNAGMFIRRRNMDLSTWETWRRCDKPGTGGLTTSPIERKTLTDFDYDVPDGIDLVLFSTSASPSHSPFNLPASVGCYAEGMIYKSDNTLFQTTWRGNQNSTDIYSRLKLGSKTTWEAWHKVNNSYTDLGKITSLDIDISTLTDTKASFVLDNIADTSSPWGDAVGDTGTIIGEVVRIHEHWYEKVWRMFPANKGTYIRRKTTDTSAADQSWSTWVKIDADVDLTEYAKTESLAAVALTNSYNSLDNKPAIPVIYTKTQAQYDALTEVEEGAIYIIRG